jgi:hypothetical protein
MNFGSLNQFLEFKTIQKGFYITNSAWAQSGPKLGTAGQTQG